jgi:protein-S-isoprenylcysteine O-methyltransferase Ste14
LLVEPAQDHSGPANRGLIRPNPCRNLLVSIMSPRHPPEKPPKGRWLIALYGLVAYLIGIRSMVYFAGFASNVPLVKTVNSGPTLGWLQALTIDAGLLLIFALPHSLMARSSFKKAFLSLFPEAALRSTYVLVAGLSLTFLMWQWQPIETQVWDIESALLSYSLYAVAAAGWLLAAIGYYSIGHLELFGLQQAFACFRGVSQPPGDLVATGIYRYLRNPMYVGFTIGIWSTPLMTAGHLLLSVGMTLYLLIGIRYEKRDLAAAFGDRYLAYLRADS